MYVFNNMKYVENLIAGDSASAQKLADLASTAMGNFCKYGDPSTDGLKWPAYTAAGGETMVFNNAGGSVRNHHDAEVLELLNKVPAPSMPF